MKNNFEIKKISWQLLHIGIQCNCKVNILIVKLWMASEERNMVSEREQQEREITSICKRIVNDLRK